MDAWLRRIYLEALDLDFEVVERMERFNARGTYSPSSLPGTGVWRAILKFEEWRRDNVGVRVG